MRIREKFEVEGIGRIRSSGNSATLEIDGEFVPALNGLEEFSHVVVLWWFSRSDNAEDRQTLRVLPPYRRFAESGRDSVGAFATRSPARPNPIAVTTARVLAVDAVTGHVQVDFIDADDGSPILDLKPYTPSLDRVESPSVAVWSVQGPKSLEESATFDWSSEFAD